MSKVCPKCQSKNITKGISAGKAKGLCAKCGHEWTMRKRKVLKLPKVPAEAPQKPAGEHYPQPAAGDAKLVDHTVVDALEPSVTPEMPNTISGPVQTYGPAPRLGTFQSGIHLLEVIAREWPEAKWMDWSTLKATMVHASRNTNTWRKVTEGR